MIAWKLEVRSQMMPAKRLRLNVPTDLILHIIQFSKIIRNVIFFT